MLLCVWWSGRLDHLNRDTAGLYATELHSFRFYLDGLSW
jgi:hypothetical protein